MTGARDLITLFVALETISIPTFVLAAFRKHDRSSNEAGVKYYLIGVLSSTLMLYGFSLIYGVTGSTKLSEISAYMSQHGTLPLVAVAIFLSLVGFAFKVERGAVPLLGARHLRGSTHPGDRVLVGRVQGRRFRRSHQHHLLRLPHVERARLRLLVAGAVGAGRAVDDDRQPRRAPPDEHRPDARVLLDRARRVHARALCRRGDRRCRRPPRQGQFGHERGCDLPADLRRHEPRCVRRRHRGRAAHPHRGDHLVRRTVPDRADARGCHGDLPGLTRGRAVLRRLVRRNS